MHINAKLAEITDCLYRVSAKALIISEGKILLVREKEGWWGIPGGGVDYGENIVDSVKRELSEEISVPVDKMTVKNKILFITTNTVIDGIPKANIYYEVTLKSNDIKANDDILEIKWAASSEFDSLNFGPSTAPIVSELKSLLLSHGSV